MRNHFFFRKTTKVHEKKKKYLWMVKGSLFKSVQFTFHAWASLCLWGAPCWPLVSDDVKYKLPLTQIHCLLEDLVSRQLQISVTQNPRSAGVR